MYEAEKNLKTDAENFRSKKVEELKRIILKEFGAGKEEVEFVVEYLKKQ